MPQVSAISLKGNARCSFCAIPFVRGLPFSTYSLGGLKKFLISAYDSTDRLREMRTRGREGVKNPKNFAYVLNGSPLIRIKCELPKMQYDSYLGGSHLELESKMTIITASTI